MGKKRASLSDKLDALKHQDERTAAGLVIMLRALADRYPADININYAVKAVAEFCTSLAQPEAAPDEEPRG